MILTTHLKCLYAGKNHWLLLFCCLFLFRAWDCFVRSLDHSYLGSLLSHVIVALLPLIHIQPKETTAVFYFLIVENRYRTKYFRLYYRNGDNPKLKLSSTEMRKLGSLQNSMLFYKIVTSLKWQWDFEIWQVIASSEKVFLYCCYKNIWHCGQVTTHSDT